MFLGITSVLSVERSPHQFPIFLVSKDNLFKIIIILKYHNLFMFSTVLGNLLK